jgi:capsular polysaccharide transport system permease protein
MNAPREVGAVGAAAAIRRARIRRTAVRLGLFVALPTLVATIYYGLVASDQYESVAAFTIQNADGPSPGGVEFFLGTMPGGAAGRDVLIVQEHVLSRSMLAHLRERFDFDAHYADEAHDVVSRLSKRADLEDIYEYFLRRVSLEHDAASGVLTLRVRAYSPEAAERFADAILGASEDMVNRMSEDARQDRMRLAESEVEKAESRLGKARAALLDFQREKDELNPFQSAATAEAVRGSLESQLAEARAELSALTAVMHAGAPKVEAQRRRVASLAAQVERERGKMVGGDGAVGESIAHFEPLLLEKEFAEQTYRSAIASLELARVEASRQHRYLVTVAAPSKPDARTHPERLRGILTVFLAAFMLLGIGSLLMASIREHANL